MSFFGIVNADGTVPSPSGTLGDGTPFFVRAVPQGFLIVVEGRPGISGRPAGTTVFNWNPEDPNALPDLQIVSSRALGDGSSAVCDNQAPSFLGGVPAVDPPVFSGPQPVADAINDLACRFSARASPGDACTVDAQRNPKFVSPDSTVQFCTVPAVGAEIAFPPGDTRLTVRLRDNAGNPGHPASIVVRIP